jgi:predicted nucleotidyltransferase
MDLQKDLFEFLQSLNSNKVKYVVVGAYAVAYHGRPRLTGDLDLYAEASADNIRRLEQAISSFSGGAISFDAHAFREPGRMMRIGAEPNRIDILNQISGVTFAEVWKNRVIGDLGGVEVSFISLDDLVTNKRSTGRLKDAADVDELGRGSTE